MRVDFTLTGSIWFHNDCKCSLQINIVIAFAEPVFDNNTIHLKHKVNRTTLGCDFEYRMELIGFKYQ